MTEISVEGISPTLSKLNNISRLIVLLGSPEGLKGVSKKFSSLQNVRRIRSGLFIVQEYSETHEALIQSQPVVSFAKTREIPTIRERTKTNSLDRGYTLVSFSYNSPTAQQKKYVERLIRKSTGIRLRPGVILFPLLKAKEKRRILGSEEERKLIDSTEFTKLVRMNGGRALRWSRLRIINLEGVNLIKDAVHQTLYRDLSVIERRIWTLRERLKDPDVSIEQLKKKYTILSRGFRELKNKWILAKKLWLYDSEKALKRIYNMLVNTRRVISSAETKVSN